MFAIDWVRRVNGRVFTGDGSKNSDWAAFGSPVYAVGDGSVVLVIDHKPDIAPNSDNPFLDTPLDFAGNTVELRIGPGLYACYAHLILGSVRVRVGRRVRVGQRTGPLGNSGNTTGPHLHFGIQSRPDCLSRSEPFEIDRYTLQGTAAPTDPPGPAQIASQQLAQAVPSAHQVTATVLDRAGSRPGTAHQRPTARTRTATRPRPTTPPAARHHDGRS
jgi:murein DD-endopeptidase MepM/ murein hydrolase activator NlpD